MRNFPQYAKNMRVEEDGAYAKDYPNTWRLLTLWLTLYENILEKAKQLVLSDYPWGPSERLFKNAMNDRYTELVRNLPEGVRFNYPGKTLEDLANGKLAHMLPHEIAYYEIGDIEPIDEYNVFYLG